MITPDREINPPETNECTKCLGVGFVKDSEELIEIEEGVYVESTELIQCNQCDGSGIEF